MQYLELDAGQPKVVERDSPREKTNNFAIYQLRVLNNVVLTLYRSYIAFHNIGFLFLTYNFVPNLSTLILTPKICISQFVKKTDAVTFLFEKHLTVTFLFEKHLPVTFLFKKHLTVTFLFCNLNLKQKFALI